MQEADLKFETEWKRIYAEDKTLLYEGNVYKDKPCGKGTSYYRNGNKYQEGRFGIKGLLSGKEYYSNGNLRFEGEFRLNTAYGPNIPVSGNVYDIDGKFIFQGRLTVHLGGVGYPKVVKPEQFGPVPLRDHPKGLMPLMWEDVREG